jgi:hypothetical protein
MREDIITYLDIFNILDALSGDDLLTREETANNRLDVSLLSALIEFDGAVHAAMVGKRQRIHPPGLRRCDQAIEL